MRHIAKRLSVVGPASLVAVNVVHELRAGRTRATAIDKRPVSGLRAVEPAGVAGDIQCNRRHHGGRDKAVYAFAVEDADWWTGQLGRAIPPGLFGENLTTAGLDVTGALVGERWRVGGPTAGCLLEVTQPRTPCSNLSFRMQHSGFHRRFAAAGRPGAYLRVLEPGRIRTGSRIVVEHRPEHGVTIGLLATAPTADHLRRLLGSDVELAPDLSRHLAYRISRTPAPG